MAGSDADAFGVLLVSGGHERAHYAFMVAATAAALGRRVVVFATNDGCRSLRRGPAEGTDEEALIARGVASLAELRAACAELEVKVMACEAGLRVAGLRPDDLAPDVEVAGLASFLAATRGGQVISL